MDSFRTDVTIWLLLILLSNYLIRNNASSAPDNDEYILLLLLLLLYTHVYSSARHSVIITISLYYRTSSRSIGTIISQYNMLLIPTQLIIILCLREIIVFIINILFAVFNRLMMKVYTSSCWCE